MKTFQFLLVWPSAMIDIPTETVLRMDFVPVLVRQPVKGRLCLDVHPAPTFPAWTKGLTSLLNKRCVLDHEEAISGNLSGL